jgi:hypothetical protein
MGVSPLFNDFLLFLEVFVVELNGIKEFRRNRLLENASN